MSDNSMDVLEFIIITYLFGVNLFVKSLTQNVESQMISKLEHSGDKITSE